ncbi:hypothetical protein [Azonexus sp.]
MKIWLPQNLGQTLGRISIASFPVGVLQDGLIPTLPNTGIRSGF